jgi:TfoX/Sxy family transcriptional regulator of competence genes
MSYDESLADRIREKMAEVPGVEEKHMFGGIAFMVNNKMCVGIIKDEMMCRIDPAIHDECVEKEGCRTMDFNKKPMKGFVMIDQSGMNNRVLFDYWISLALEFNLIAKETVKKSKTKSPSTLGNSAPK